MTRSCEELLKNLSKKDVTIVATTPELRNQGYAIFAIALVAFPAFWLAFLYWRNSFESLRKRNFLLLTVFNFSAMGFCIITGLNFIIGDENFDCHLFIFTNLFFFALLFCSYFIRVFSYIYRIKFNQGLINSRFEKLKDSGYIMFYTPSDTGERVRQGSSFVDSIGGTKATKIPKKMRFPTLKKGIMTFFCWKRKEFVPSYLQFTFFLSSHYFANMLILVILVLLVPASIVSSTSVLPLDEACLGCALMSGESFLGTSIFTACLIVLISYKLWNYPDSLGVKAEVYCYGLVIVFFHTIFIEIPFSVNKNLRDAEAEKRTNTVFFACLEVMLVAFYSLPYQVYRAGRATQISHLHETIHNVIDNDEGTKALLLYLCTCFTQENLMFYKTVQGFEEFFDSNSYEINLRFAENIRFMYIETGSDKEINIAGADRSRLIEQISEGKLTKNMFSPSALHCLELISDAFAKFLKSSYYSAYKNTIVKDVSGVIFE